MTQHEDNLGALANLRFDDDELAEIDRSATQAEINTWSTSSDAWSTARGAPPAGVLYNMP